MKLTVVIPTFDRPEYLRFALESIRKQTLDKNRFQVVVSENGKLNDSKFVCDSFLDLNITYIKQDLQLSVLDHFKWIFSFNVDGYVAILCDDDWWHERHLEIAINSLESTNQKAYFSNFIYFDSEKYLKVQGYFGSELFTLVKEDITSVTLNKLNIWELYQLSYLFTPFHFSSWVISAEILSKCGAFLSLVHPTYADRVLIPEIAFYGDVIFNPLITCFVRWHEKMDSTNYSQIEWQKEAILGSNFVEEQAFRRGYKIKNGLNAIYEKANEKNKALLNYYLTYIFRDEESLKWYLGYSEIVQNKKNVEFESKSYVRIYRFIKSIVREIKRFIKNFLTGSIKSLINN